MLPMNYIREYYGEKVAFYFCWVIHYTGWLIIPALFGIAGAIIQAVQADEGEDIYQTFNSSLNGLYAVFIILWATLMFESWKRKEN